MADEALSVTQLTEGTKGHRGHDLSVSQPNAKIGVQRDKERECGFSEPLATIQHCKCQISKCEYVNFKKDKYSFIKYSAGSRSLRPCGNAFITVVFGLSSIFSRVIYFGL